MDCSICLEDHNEKNYKLECNHHFHIKCLYMYIYSLSENNIKCMCKFMCPLCRNYLDIRDISKLLLEYSIIVYNINKIYKKNLMKIKLQMNLLKSSMCLNIFFKYKINYKKIRNYIILINEYYILKSKIKKIDILYNEISLVYTKCLNTKKYNCYLCNNFDEFDHHVLTTR